MNQASENQITILSPDDWHLHLRDEEQMRSVVGDSARQFHRALVMPNLAVPVDSCDKALAYRERILAARPADSTFEPMMALYLTPATTAAELKKAAELREILAIKLYPSGSTTNSSAGISSMEAILPLLEAMQLYQLPLCIHCEVSDPEVDIFDREAVFIERHLEPICNEFPDLRVVFEHITTATGVEFVKSARSRVGATITAHHLLIDRNHIFKGGLNPHNYCLPIAKLNSDREAIVKAAISGNPRFFAGTDSAPHPLSRKASGSAPAGIYTAHNALELYAEVFEKKGALAKLENFTSKHGAAFYGLPINSQQITLIKEEHQTPETLPFGADQVVPFRAGETIGWKVVS